MGITDSTCFARRSCNWFLYGMADDEHGIGAAAGNR